MDERRALEHALESRSGEAAPPGLSRAIQERLGRELREIYAETQREPLTDRLAELLRQLERKTPDLIAALKPGNAGILRLSL
jgi:alcohol dehydrogenase class IV